MAVALFLAVASLIPIVAFALVRVFRCVRSDSTEYEGPIKRIATNASTMPMMPDRFEEQDNRSQRSSDEGEDFRCEAPAQELS